MYDFFFGPWLKRSREVLECASHHCSVLDHRHSLICAGGGLHYMHNLSSSDQRQSPLRKKKLLFACVCVSLSIYVCVYTPSQEALSTVKCKEQKVHHPHQMIAILRGVIASHFKRLSCPLTRFPGRRSKVESLCQ